MAAVGTLTIEMAANVARLQRDMDRATKTVSGSMDRIQRSVQGATRALGVLTAAFATVKSIQGIVQQADAMTQLNSRLRLVTTSQEEFIKIQGALLSVSQRTYTSIGATVDLYTALARSTKDVGVSQNELLRVVETFNKAIIISGGSVQAAEAAITQFNQAMASGVLRGEEFNSISEQAPMIMEILANQLGVTRGALRDMAKEGLLVADLVLPALIDGSKGVDEQFNNMSMTVGQATNQLAQSLALLINQIDQSTGFTKFLAESISSLGSTIRGLSSIVDDNRYALIAWAGVFLAPAVVTGITTLIASLAALRVAILGITAALAANPIGLALLALTAAAVPAINAMNEYFVAQDKAKQSQDGFNETAAETNRLLRQNEEAAKGNNAAVMSTARAMLEKQKADALAKKAADELQKSYDNLVSTLEKNLRASTAALQAEQQGLNNAQEEFLELVSSPEWQKYSETQKMIVTDLFKQRIETEQLIDLEKKRAKAAEDRLKKMLADEKEFREELKKEDEKLAKEKLKKEQEFYEEQRREIEKIGDQLTDALMRAFESGKGFGQAFKDTLVNMFRTMVLRPVLAPIVGGLLGGASGPAAAGTGTMDIISGVTQMYSIVTTGFAKVGATVSAALQNAGDYLATSSIDAVAAGGEFLQTIAQSAGPIASSIAGAATGMFLNSLISGGYSMGKGADTFQKIGIAVASFVGGPVLGAIVGAATGFVNRLFGRKLSDVGIEGTFGDSGFTGQSYKFYKGGLFKSDQTKRSPLDAELESFLSDSFLAMQGATAAMAIALNQSADSIFAFTKDIKLSFKGLTEEQIQAKLTETFEGLANDLSQLALGTEEFTKRGETASETLQRLYQSVINVNSVFDTLGLKMYEFTLVGADMASQLVDLLGGMENFVTATTFYYEQFYSEAERVDILTRQLTTSFEQLGLKLPITRDAFRDLIEAQDLTTESGRQLFAALMNLSPAFTTITKSTEEIEQEIQTLLDAATQRRLAYEKEIEDRNKEAERVRLQLLQDTYNKAEETTSALLATIQRSIDAQKESLELSAQAAEEQVQNIQSVFDVLNNAILDLTGGGFNAITGQAFIQQALLAAQTSGYLPDPNELSRAISAVRSGLSSGAGSAFEARREQALFVARLTQLREFAGDQLSTAEQTLQGINLQIIQLDEQLTAAQEQVNVLRGIDTGIRDIPTSIASLQTALTNELRALTELQIEQARVNPPVVIPTETPTIPGGLTLNPNLANQTGPFPPTYGSNSITINRPAGQTGQVQTITIGGKKVDVLTLDLSAYGTVNKQFAAGGMHSGGLRLVGERGPELEMTGPARYMSNANLSTMMNGDKEEIRALREDNRVQMRSLISLQNRMTKLLERWDGDGLPEERVVT